MLMLKLSDRFAFKLLLYFPLVTLYVHIYDFANLIFESRLSLFSCEKLLK